MRKPSRHFRLTTWWLLYRIPVSKELSRKDEVDACHHSRLSIAKWDEQKVCFPKEWAKLLFKRKRRLKWFAEHGSVPDGWTPPDPKDPRRTSWKPIHAYLARRKLTLDEFTAMGGFIPLQSKLHGRSPTNWHLYHKIKGWQKEHELTFPR